jgi:hypothetical protein
MSLSARVGYERAAPAPSSSHGWVSYGEAIFQASLALEEHLAHLPDDCRRDISRHAGPGGLFDEVVTSHPEVGDLHLSVVMWDRAVAMAVTQLDLTDDNGVQFSTNVVQSPASLTAAARPLLSW